MFWEDYREGPARQWNEVPWVRFRAYLTRDKLIARFGPEKGRKVNLDHTPRGGSELLRDDPPPDAFKKAIVHDVWDKTAKRVIWYAPGTIRCGCPASFPTRIHCLPPRQMTSASRSPISSNTRTRRMSSMSSPRASIG